MSRTTKLLVLLEALICFSPAALLLVSCLRALFDVANPYFPLLSPLFFLCSLCGCLGLIGVIALIIELIIPQHGFLSPKAIQINLAVGIVPLLPITLSGIAIQLSGTAIQGISPLSIVFLLPILCTFHLIWLARRYASKPSG